MIGAIADLTSGSKTKKTTLQKEMKNFEIIICIIAVTAITICLIVWGAWIRPSYPNFISNQEILINAMAILLVFVPTGLPCALTLSLLVISRRMARNKVLVKNLTTVMKKVFC
jgi:sodium/potassium-transporting ATPase subunit alpha